MKKWIPAAMALTLLACNSEKKPAEQPIVASSSADAKPAETPKAAPDTATANRNSAAYMTPGPEHKMLAEADRNWEAEVSYWAKPGAPEAKSTMMVSNKMI